MKKVKATHLECTKCHQVKSIADDFYTHKGYVRKRCKLCFRSKVKQYYDECWDEEHIKRKKEYMKQYYLDNREKFTEAQNRFKDRHPDYNPKDGLQKQKAITPTKGNVLKKK